MHSPVFDRGWHSFLSYYVPAIREETIQRQADTQREENNDAPQSCTMPSRSSCHLIKNPAGFASKTFHLPYASGTVLQGNPLTAHVLPYSCRQLIRLLRQADGAFQQGSTIMLSCACDMSGF